jgi:hypothetical protein
LSTDTVVAEHDDIIERIRFSARLPAGAGFIKLDLAMTGLRPLFDEHR